VSTEPGQSQSQSQGAPLALLEYETALLGWLRHTPRARIDDLTVLDPELMSLDPDARQQWIAFHDAVELAQ